MPAGTIVAFGNFDLEGARSWVIRTGLSGAGYTVALCRTEVPGFFGKYRDLMRRWNSATQASQSPVAAIYVVFLGHYLMPLAWWLGKKSKIPVIFDAFLSLHDTEVFDRRRVSRFSPKAWLLWFTDWLGCALADVVLLDTEEHKDYFVKTYGVDPAKILVLPVGCRSDLFIQGGGHTARQPQAGMPALSQKNDGLFHVEFHGTYIPLQGTDIILIAARELQKRGENIQFTLIGTQMEQALMPRANEWGLTNIRFHRSVTIDKLPQFIHDADVCLGIFGTTKKADRVIPNKAYEVISCGKPLITGNTTAARRVLRNKEQVLFCGCGEAGELADAIMQLKNDAALRQTIADGGLALSQSQFTPAKIVEPLVVWLSSRLVKTTR
ncbi:glycosyltransferase [Candidatus Peribacteria bacterium]|nr:glycosyltransferase [Candidatus Peribacteria bacterium]